MTATYNCYLGVAIKGNNNNPVAVVDDQPLEDNKAFKKTLMLNRSWVEHQPNNKSSQQGSSITITNNKFDD